MSYFMIKRFFTLFLTFLATVTLAFSAESVRFAQVTDVNFFSDSEPVQEYLDALVDSINNTSNLDFVVFTGDNIYDSNSKYLKDFLTTIKGLNIPYYIVLGDTDVFESGGLSKTRYLEILRSFNIFSPGKPNYTFEKKGTVFVVVDGAKEKIPTPNGYYRQETLEWLEAVLQKNKNKNVVILQHFPLINAPKSAQNTYKAEEYLKVLDKHDNVVAVISGHYHINLNEMRNGVYHITTQSYSQEPHSYKIIEIRTDKNLLPMVIEILKRVDI